MFAWFLAESPVVIVGCGDKKASRKWHVIDTAIVMQNMVLAATAEGLGTCWVGSFKQERIREMLRIPDRFKIVSKMKKIVSLEEYGEPFL